MFRLLNIVLLFLFISCNNDSVKKEEEISECRELTILVEDCIGLHRGALNYIDSCGSLDIEQAKMNLTCEDLLYYFGIGDISGDRDR